METKSERAWYFSPYIPKDAIELFSPIEKAFEIIGQNPMP